MIEIISIHISKCAGTTFNYALKSKYNVFEDYETPPDQDIEEKIPVIPEDCNLIHGHIRANKYDQLFPKAKLITWVRDPWERANSHYRFRVSMQKDWKDEKLPPQAPEEFINFPFQINFIARFFAGKKPEDFTFIGIVENFDQDFETFCRMFDYPIPHTYNHYLRTENEKFIPFLNKNTNRLQMEKYNYFEELSE